MKRILLVTVASFLLFQVSDAQIFKYGIKAGVGFSSLRIDDLTITNGNEAYELVTGETVTGYHVGVQTRVKIAMVYVQPEVYFNAGGGTLERVASGGPEEALEVEFNRIDVPILVGVKLGPARLNVGPVGSYVISETTTTELPTVIPQDYTVFTSSMTWGFQAGIGVDIMKKVSVDARYEGSLSQLGESITFGSNEFALDARPSQWLISLGYWF